VSAQIHRGLLIKSDLMGSYGPDIFDAAAIGAEKD
jgi:hypothetical protein